MNKLFLGLLVAAIFTACSSSDSKPLVKTYPVKTAVVIKKDLPLYVESIGHLQEYQSVELRPRIGGLIVEAYLTGGEYVNLGDLLFKIDPIPFEIEMHKAAATLIKDEALLEFFRSRYDRYSKLVKKEFVAPLTVEEYQRDVGSQEAQVLLDKALVEMAELNLSYSMVRATLSGKVSLDIINVGNIVQGNDQTKPPLAKIFQIDPIYVYFTLAQREFQAIQEKLAKDNDRTLNVYLPHDTHPPITGKLDALDNNVSTESGTIQMRGILENQKKILWPGQYATVRLSLGIKPDTLVVPVNAVQFGQSGTTVFTIDQDGIVTSRPVDLGERVDEVYMVNKGLDAGMTVVTEGQLNLRNGSKVNVVGDGP